MVSNSQSSVGEFTGKVGLIMGVANRFSIATGISTILKEKGAELAFSYLPDVSGKMAARVKKVCDNWQPAFIAPCDVLDDQSIEDFFTQLSHHVSQIDFLVHSIAYAPIEDLKKNTLETSRAGFLKAMDVSVYSFMACAHQASRLMKNGGSIVTLTYYGSEKAIPGYNVMGVAKAALESAIRYGSYELGAQGIRVNGVSAGPIKTLASSAVGVSKMIKHTSSVTPLDTPLTQRHVGEATYFLVGDHSKAITGEIIHVDNGYHAIGM